MRRRALILAGATLPISAAAQSPPPQRRPAQAPSRVQPPAATPVAPEPPPPIAARPVPVLPPAPPPPPPPALNEPPVPLAPGLAELPNGGWRIRFAGNADAPAAEQSASLRAVAGRLAERSTGRVTLFAEASVGEDVSSRRRLSLERARAVKAVLEAGGLDPRRVDIRALGRTQAAADLVDIIPPGVARP
jgi:outer membrane protein OmpA-like peptidoglycan-associated protein